jgi:hypothetical protein
MVKLNWKRHQVLGCDYYYSFYEEKFLCIKAEYVLNGITTDSEFVFQGTVDQMDLKTKDGLLAQMINLFPELKLMTVKKALRYQTT